MLDKNKKAKTEDELRAKLRDIHDGLKIHPFWTVPSPKGMDDAGRRFLDAESLIFSYNGKKSDELLALNKIASAINHDFNKQAFGRWWGDGASYKYGDFSSFLRSEDFGKLVLMEQRFLSLIHQYLDGEPLESFRGYRFDPESCVVARRWTAPPVDSAGYDWRYSKGTIRALPLVKKKNLPAWKDSLKKAMDREDDDRWRQIYAAALRSIDADDGRYCVIID